MGNDLGRPVLAPRGRSPFAPRRRASCIPVSWPASAQLVAQRDGMLHAVADGGAAVALEAGQVARRGAGDHGVGLLRLSVLEDTGALEHEGAAPAADATDDPLE